MDKIDSYVCGFLFSVPPIHNLKTHTQVLLIKKSRPDWQKDHLNGIGGKINPYETPIAAMRREFEEETGLNIFNWLPLEHRVYANKARVGYFASWVSEEVFMKPRTLTDEPLVRLEVNVLQQFPLVEDVEMLVKSSPDKFKDFLQLSYKY